MFINIEAIQYHLPLRTEDSATLVADNPDWRMAEIEAKTGVLVRHIAAAEETAVDLGFLAAKKLLDAGIDKESIGFLVLVTQSPDFVLPTSACILQDRLGLPSTCMAFDINLGCSGFVYALAVCGSLIESGTRQRGLIVCSDTYTKFIAKDDRTCRPIFSDGAAAVLIAKSSTDQIGPFELGTDGSGHSSLIVPSSGTRQNEGTKVAPQLFMAGAEVFMFTMNRVPECIEQLLEKSNNQLEDIDLFVFHQASRLVIDNIIRRLGLPEEKVFTNMAKIGNTVSASIPIALRDAVDAGRLKAGYLVMIVGFGVGLSWGGCLVRWAEDK